MLALMKYYAELNRDIELARGETLQELWDKCPIDSLQVGEMIFTRTIK